MDIVQLIGKDPTGKGMAQPDRRKNAKTIDHRFSWFSEDASLCSSVQENK